MMMLRRAFQTEHTRFDQHVAIGRSYVHNTLLRGLSIGGFNYGKRRMSAKDLGEQRRQSVTSVQRRVGRLDTKVAAWNDRNG